MQQPLVSIIMPTFNRSYIIQQAIDSITVQTYANWELIIMDDGSSDNTKEIVTSLSNSRIHYHQQTNQGPAAARNHAIKEARGDLIAYLDSDNTFLPRYLETMVDHFQKHPRATYGIPQGNYTLELYIDDKLVDSVDKTDQFPARLTIQDIFHRKIHFDMNGFMHKQGIFGNDIQFDTTLSDMEDWDLVLQMGTKYPDGFSYIPHILYAYRQRYGADGLVGNTKVTYGSYARIFEEIYAKHHSSPLMNGQPWYPGKVNKWNELEVKYQAGKLPPLYLHPFPSHWPKHLS